jgi:hypothetical protein
MTRATLMIIAAACTLFAAEPAKRFTGVITDTMCGAKPHSEMMKDKSDAECIRICARGANSYALFDGTTVMKLSDQKTPAQYAGQRVTVTGVYDEKARLLKVVSMEPAVRN